MTESEIASEPDATDAIETIEEVSLPEPQGEPQRPEPTPTQRAGLVARSIEWLFRINAARDAKRDTTVLNAVQRVRYERARAAATVADSLIGTGTGGAATGASLDEGVDVASVRALAISLYREAAFWALAADRSELSGRAVPEVFEQSRALALRSVGGNEDRLAKVKLALADRTFVETAEVSEADLENDVTISRDFIQAMLVELRRRADPVLAVETQRWSRIGTVCGILLVSAVVANFGFRYLMDALRPDLAATAHWRVSSHLDGFAAEGTGVHPPVAAPVIFFHTNDDPSPWIDFDLHRSVPIYRVVVKNREDCCGERSVPLVLELSDDDVHWSPVAQQTEQFAQWNATFPRRSARYVRLRVAHHSILHLAGVEIH